MDREIGYERPMLAGSRDRSEGSLNTFPLLDAYSEAFSSEVTLNDPFQSAVCVTGSKSLPQERVQPFLMQMILVTA